MNLHEQEGLAALCPINFVQVVHSIPQVVSTELPALNTKAGKKHLLPTTSSLCYEHPFAEVGVGWNSDGIAVAVDVAQPVRDVTYPDVTSGDSVELFIDTRDIKNSGFNTRFCHHFYFLPQAVEGHQAGEITHFRTDDAHELCDPNRLVVKSQKWQDRYTIHIFIPSQCLNGYDPEQCNRLGFSYRINRPDGPQQHFSAVTQEYNLEQQPALWSSVYLIK